MTKPFSVIAYCVVLLLASVVTQAQQPPQKPVQLQDLSSMNLEDLMNVQVTSVSKKEQKLSRTAAAIFVITQDDIARSGATNIPDLLRMVPGLDVAQIDASSWAISARGFNQQSSDKLLVLMDGRTLYSPIYSSVLWDVENVPLEDIDRIEVIRGPGASVWGVNAVNGVISIITKKASQTLGLSVTSGGGTSEQAFATAQYGGKLGDEGAYRISSNYEEHNHSENPLGQSGEDAWNILRADFRADKQLTSKDSLSVGITGTSGGEGETVPIVTSLFPPVNQILNLHEQFSSWDITSDWNHAFSATSDTSLKIYFDRVDRIDPDYSIGVDTFDIDFQHQVDWSGRQNIVWGMGYRRISDSTVATSQIAFNPADQTQQVFSSFVQDEIAIRPDRLYLTLGAKLEHNDFTGFTFQPSLRVAWIPNEHSMVWSAFSVAKRTPSVSEIDVQYVEAAAPGPFGLPILYKVFGNPQEKNENLYATELGYRRQIGKRLSVDLTTFFNHYSDLRSAEPLTPFLQLSPGPPHILGPYLFANSLYGETHGAEAAVTWKVSSRWTLSPGYAFLAMHLHTVPTSADIISVPLTQGGSPTHQAQIRSQLALPSHLEFDASTYFVSPLLTQGVPSYTRLDSGITWHGGEQLSMSVFGQNLLRDHHLETNNAYGLVEATSVKRSVYAKLTWTIR